MRFHWKAECVLLYTSKNQVFCQKSQLPVCRSIAQLHGWSAVCASDSPGATFLGVCVSISTKILCGYDAEVAETAGVPHKNCRSSELHAFYVMIWPSGFLRILFMLGMPSFIVKLFQGDLFSNLIFYFFIYLFRDKRSTHRDNKFFLTMNIYRCTLVSIKVWSQGFCPKSTLRKAGLFLWSPGLGSSVTPTWSVDNKVSRCCSRCRWPFSQHSFVFGIFLFWKFPKPLEFRRPTCVSQQRKVASKLCSARWYFIFMRRVF